MAIGLRSSSEAMTRAMTRAETWPGFCQPDTSCADIDTDMRQFPDLSSDFEKYQKLDQLFGRGIEKKSDHEERPCRGLPSHIRARRCESPVPHADTSVDNDELEELEDADRYDDLEERVKEESPCTSLRPRVPSPDSVLIEGVRAQILANTSMILLLKTGHRKQPDLLAVRLRCGRYMAVVALENPEGQLPVARLVKSGKYFSLVEAYAELLELVSEDLYTELQFKMS